MKKILITAIVTLAFFGKGASAAAETSALFAIYLSHTNAISTIPLSKMELSKEPFLTDADITEYKWKNHEIILSRQGAKKYEQLVNSRNTTGKSFVVMARGIRCYRGAFWKGILSVSYPKPVILLDALPLNRIRIERAYPSEKFAEGNDPRNDVRIREILMEKGKLKETSD